MPPRNISFKTPLREIPEAELERTQNAPNYTGGFGDVWRCLWSTSCNPPVTVAIKAVRVPDSSETALLQRAARGIRREAHVLANLSHDNILPLYGITTGFGVLPAFVSPWMKNGSLDNYLRREVGLSWERKLSMVREIAAGLQYLHQNDVVHGDLTPTNVLVSSDGRPCLSDFGLSMMLAESGNPTFNSCHAGNVRWMAPELVEEQAKPTMAGDVYSCGCIMIQVFSGEQPYAPLSSPFHIMTAIIRGRKPFGQITGIDKEIERFAQLCLSSNTQDRPSVGQIVEFLWSQTDIAKTMKTMLSQLLVTVTRISQADLTKCDHHPYSLGVLGAALKCKWIVHGSSEIEVAVKILRDNVDTHNDVNKVCDRICREVHVRERLRHETILALYGMTEGFGILPSFVYPWMAGGSLHDYVKREYSNLSTRRKLDILLEVAHGIEYLHKQDVAHGNLTGDNVFLDGSGRVRIADFSHSVILAEADSRMFREQLPGDARYTAPESIFTFGQTGAPMPTKEGDVYSYGCVAILVLSGKVPYWWISAESQVLVEKAKGTSPFYHEVEIDEAHLNLVRQCLLAKKSRPSIEKVLYLVLVRSFGATDLTTWVERPNKVHQNTGGFGIVHRCKLDLSGGDAVEQMAFCHQFPSVSTRVYVAVKEIILRGDTDMLTIINRLFREITRWLKLEHKNIVPLWGVADGFGSLPALVSPWLENGALTGYLHREHKVLFYNEKFALLKDIAEGLQYLHLKSITHGDLSGNNVLINKGGKASLTDFGFSALLPERKSQVLVPIIYGGTASYMAPECLMLDNEGDESALVLSPKSDIYSFGGIMLQVLEGKVPYHYIRNHAAIINNISRGIRPKRPPTSVVGDSDWNFIQSCWLEDMEGRPSDEDVLEFVEGRARIQS